MSKGLLTVLLAIGCLVGGLRAERVQQIQQLGHLSPGQDPIVVMPVEAPSDLRGSAPVLTPIAVPEPATIGMLFLGAGLLVGLQRFRRKLG
jgi:hypothetical protein